MVEQEPALLARYVDSRDAEAFRSLVEGHQNMVFAACHRILDNRADAEDAAQNCFLQLARNAGRLRAPIAGWLHTVAVHQSIDMLRRDRSRKAREARAARQRIESDDLTWDQVKGAVDEAIAALPERLRIAIVLHYLEGRKQEEMAAGLGITQSAVSKRLKRGIVILRKQLKKAGVVASALALGAIISGNAAEAAPATLTASLGKMALAGGAGGKVAVATAGATGATAGGISVVKTALIGAVVAGALIAGGMTVKEAVTEETSPQPARPTVEHVIYAERLDTDAFFVLELSNGLSGYRRAFALQRDLDPTSTASFPDDAEVAKDLFGSKDATTVDLEKPICGFFFDLETAGQPPFVFSVTDGDAYLNSLADHLEEQKVDGNLHVYTDTRNQRQVAIGIVGNRAVIAKDEEVTRGLLALLEEGKIPAGPVFPKANFGVLYNIDRVFGTAKPFAELRKGLGIEQTPEGQTGSPLAAAVDVVEASSEQMQTVAFAVRLGDEAIEFTGQVQPVAGTALAKDIAEHVGDELELLKYVPADSIAAIAWEHSGFAPMIRALDAAGATEPTARLAAQFLHALGDEVALSLCRGPAGTVPVMLALQVKDREAMRAALDAAADQVQAILQTQKQGGAPVALSLKRGDTTYNNETITVWDFDLVTTAPAGMVLAAWVSSVLGPELKIYELHLDDACVLAFGPEVLKNLEHIIDGKFEPLAGSEELAAAIPDMPEAPFFVGYVASATARSWALELAQKFGLPVQPAAGPVTPADNRIGIVSECINGIIEARVRVPRPAVDVAALLMQDFAALRPQPTSTAATPRSPLLAAAIAGDKAEVQRLLDEGADVNAPSGNSEWTALHGAARHGHIETAKLLLAADAAIDVGDRWQITSLHYAAKGGHVEMITLLAGSGAQINAPSNVGRTPLWLAADNGHKDAAELLLRLGARAEIAGHQGRTAYDQAMRRGHVEVADLIKSLAGKVSIHAAAAMGDLDAVKEFVKKDPASVNALAWDQGTALHCAATGGRTEIVQYLLASGAEVNAIDDQGNTPLQMAVKGGHEEVAELLRARGGIE